MQQSIQPLVPAPLAYKPQRTRTDLFSALLRASREFGGGKTIVVDGDERALTYKEIIRAAFGLGSALKKGTRKGEAVAIMLPTGVGAVIAFYAVSAFGRVPAMLNFTAGSKNLKAAMKAAKVKRIITAHKFVELGGLETLIEDLSKVAEIIYLEDVRENLSLGNKLTAVAGTLLPGLVAAGPSHKKPAVILFTSGTEGEPKGVVLSHENVMANVEQVRAHIGLGPDTDVLFNPLPMFHCFGLTVGAILPIVAGIKVFFHPSPLQPKEIVRRISEHKPTIMLATDTFISQYARTAEDGDLSSIRLAVCGAERVKDETRAYVRRKFDIEILEGYGATEASPVVAANQWEDNRPGTVGKLMSDMESRLVPVEGMPEGGKLHIRGPNIMLGYLRPSNPGVIEKLIDGWHDTGDIVTVDEDGFIRIMGRVKRFAKIGGEMVSLAVVENCAAAVWPDNMHAAVTLPDPKKGEQVILLTDAPEATREPILSWAKQHGVPEISVPRRVFRVAEIPVLGTGKVDYGAVGIAAERLMND
ncbi:2-acylglycerophosphoethanolamine acyltransferase/Acyl-[acyl-carrier-protein] synthetase [Hyphomonas neptunium ATCC 15444]|uniref:2-acylglycerophosphoethanolamine acyltransferase/Acyl-[acyl-carrier-protein] synthetase n=2 Tax=Hyphomonas TaxID=85 RepID=Q0C0M2_HYPNA|nr:MULTISPECIES: AMP-binding protein [Hyphomonas]ABI75576.1 2-acylglycerophosphoethanolamine acyltransferase/Acyl-[acyl-carrier-protein] synthetase [Hyphomonas neptunium ATCC 15444]KCZ84010.1 2-acylglycerophosphoethanolamine acyltransferase [Hyphomonas hirschiana VP5]